MPEFNGFQDTTIVGKNDLTLGSSVKKVPQNNTVIHEYNTLPIPPSSSPLSVNMKNDLFAIKSNTTYEKFNGSKFVTNQLAVIPIDTQQAVIPLFRSSTESSIMNRVWVGYNFDGDDTSSDPGYRACAWGGEDPSFTWYDFVSGTGAFADGYNPNPGGLNPWSLKAWYQWGIRNFEIHMPFGRPNIATVSPTYQNYEHLSYQADAYLCAAEGWADMEISRGNPTNWLVNDFIEVWYALINGDQGTMLKEQWDELLTWFDPSSKIKVIVYNGTISRYNDITENQYPRWNRLFAASYANAIQRLKTSVQPFIDCGMEIALDALTIAPGSEPGAYIPTSVLSQDAQRGWWEFYKWLRTQIPTSKLYCESHPYRRTNLYNGREEPSPYLDLNVISAEDWSYFPETNRHYLSEMGDIKYFRHTYWGIGLGPKTSRRNPNLSPARYADLHIHGVCASDGEMRIPLVGGETYMGGFEHLHVYAARNLRDRFDQEYDPNPNRNVTIPHYILPTQALQVYPSEFVPSGQLRFIDRFPTGASFQAYLESYTTPFIPPVIETRNTSDTIIPLLPIA